MIVAFFKRFVNYFSGVATTFASWQKRVFNVKIEDMKKMQLAWRRGLFGVLAMLGLGSALLVQPAAATSLTEELTAATTTFAATACSGDAILGFVPWYSGLECEADGSISSDYFSSSSSSSSADTIATFVWTIILNVVSDVLLAVGYVALGMVIYSGFTILTAQGEAERMAKGRKMLIATAVGAAIAIFATLAVRLIIGVLT